MNPIFDATFNLYGKPDLISAGWKRIRTEDRAFLKAIGPNQYDPRFTDEVATRALAQACSSSREVLCIDIEGGEPEFRFDIRTAGQSAVNQSVARMQEIVGYIRDEAPDVRIGWYGDGFFDDYWTPVNGHPDLIASWQHARDYVRNKMGGIFDFVCPSLYTYYADMAGWTKYATLVLADARKWGVSIYPYLSPQYEDNPQLANVLIPTGWLDLEIAHCFTPVKNVQPADGVAIWLNGNGSSWNPQAEWLQSINKYV